MRTALALALLAALTGCASHKTQDLQGTWINRNAIEAAVDGDNLRQALLANGPNFEWRIDTQASQATFSNGFEKGEGHLMPEDKGTWQVDFYGNYAETLSFDGDELVQAASDSGPRQAFAKSNDPAEATAPIGSTFESALYSAYLGGEWKVVEGPGQGATLKFLPDGRLEGMPDLDRYALCLAGDCAAMSGEFDSLWLEKDGRGNPWMFTRKGKHMEIFQAVNQAAEDEMPQLRPGTRRWVLEQQ